MTEEQAQNWLTLEGWCPVGHFVRGSSGHWYGVVNQRGTLVAINCNQGAEQIRVEYFGPAWAKVVREREYLSRKDAKMFAAYIQENGL